MADKGTNFAVKDFHKNAIIMAISVKNIPLETHWSIGAVEHYHAILRRAYEILNEELKGENFSKKFILQIAVKTVNDTA